MTADAIRECETELRDVRRRPLGELVADATSEFDSALDLVLRELSATGESLAAFGSAP